MAKDKDRTLNPAAAQRKAEKQKALKKGKAAVAAQRTERYANRNPRRLESTISDLQALKESQGDKLSARDQRQLEETERDVARVQKAREVLGDKAPRFSTGRGKEDRGRGKDDRGRGSGGYGGLGKRARDEKSSGEETDESVRRIPWPRDTPPPLPRPRRDAPGRRSTNANSEQLGADRRIPFARELSERQAGGDERNPDMSLPAKPTPRTTYESAPQVRDLRQEATARFMPTAVKRKINAVKGVGGKLLEEEELDRMEGEGSVGGSIKTEVRANGIESVKKVAFDAGPGVGGRNADVGEMERRRLEEEEKRFRREMETDDEAYGGPTGVTLEEVNDEDA